MILPEFFVNTKEVNFHHLGAFIFDPNGGRNGWDESDEFSGAGGANGTEPVHVPPRRRQRPTQKLGRVIKTEHIVIVLHVILVQKSVQFFKTLFIAYLNNAY